ncbi:MAG: DUF4332 domain-containing protein [Candidatus Hodarchaeales archaeon]|jgi:predicted flap endonuclease-1-like 5' DNA nuclease
MNEMVFREFLKKSGRKPSVVERYIKFVNLYENYLGFQAEDEQRFTEKNLVDFVTDYEKKTKKSARTILYALMQYFNATNNNSMYKSALELRQPRKVKKTPFLLKKILGIDSKYIAKLNTLGVRNVNDMINSGKTPALRKSLAEKTGIPPKVILELVKISDLTRVGYVKEKLSRLYYNAGVQIPEDLAKWEAKKLHKHFEEYIKRTKWDGMVPYLSDLKHNITNAKKLKSVVEYE